MSFNQKSKPAPRDMYLIQSLKGRYVPYITKPEPVYGQKYESYSGDNKNYDPEKEFNLEHNPQELRRKQEQTQRYLDEQSSYSCPIWVGVCFKILCCGESQYDPTSVGTMSAPW